MSQDQDKLTFDEALELLKAYNHKRNLVIRLWSALAAWQKCDRWTPTREHSLLRAAILGLSAEQTPKLRSIGPQLALVLGHLQEELKKP